MDLSDLKPRAKHLRKASDADARSKNRNRMQVAQTDTEMEDSKPKPIPAKAKASATKAKRTNVVENGKALESSREDHEPAREKAVTTTIPAPRPRGRPKKTQLTQEETPAPSAEISAPKTRPAVKKRKLNAD